MVFVSPTASSYSRCSRRSPRGFTLIELLIVVAIIAILAAIAVPNFMEAQTRSKVSRTKADMRSLGTAIESYRVDENDYPPCYGLSANGRDSLAVLSTPIAYMTGGKLVDPFAITNPTLSKVVLTYEAISADNRIIETSSKSGPSGTWVLPTDPMGRKAAWWWVASRGPNNKYDGFSGTPSMEQLFFESDLHPDQWMTTVYDPTNGTISQGNIYRAGGSVQGFAGQTMVR